MTDAEHDRIAAVCAEMRAKELVTALRHAVSGAPHWRYEASTLLLLIDGGQLPERGYTELRQRDDHKRAAEILEDVAYG